MRIGVVADDITGSNDIGIMFSLSGCRAFVYNWPVSGDLEELLAGTSPQDVIILNTQSRLDEPGRAYQKVHAATLALTRAGCNAFFNKTCSVFRGNIGAEFDAMLDALGLDFAPIMLGFPKNGRLTVGGIHYVHGQPLASSEFRHDPIHPMLTSDLVEILSGQTRRKVSGLHADVIQQGASKLRQAISALKKACNYLILDVTCQADLCLIAEAVHDEPVLCGSSALAEELPRLWGVSPSSDRILNLPLRERTGVLCVAGSLMPQTIAQVQALRQHGAASFELDGQRLFDPAQREAHTESLAEAIAACLSAGQDVVFHSAQDQLLVEETRTAGERLGCSRLETARLVEQTLAVVTAWALKLCGQNRLVVAGGETSAAVCSELGVAGLEIWREIQPGLPSCLSLASPETDSDERYLLVLKSGSFGTDDFLIEAIDHLKIQ
jgi:uncharacterized protein YgbK (DUF1537 family)